MAYGSSGGSASGDDIEFNSSNATVSESVSTTDNKAKAITFLPEILQNEKLKTFSMAQSSRLLVKLMTLG